MKKRIAATVAILLCAALVALGAVAYFRDSGYQTVTALSYDAEQTVEVTGVFVREEITVPISGTAVSYLLSDGDKVGDGEEIARIYSSGTEVSAARRIRELSEELEDLTTAAAYYGGETAAVLTPETVIGQIREVNARIDRLTALGDADGIAQLRRELVKLLNKYNAYFSESGTTANYAARITELEQTVSALKRQIGNYRSVKAARPGYFYSVCDGCESLKPADLDNITLAKVEDLIAGANASEGDGSARIVTAYRWYFTFELPLSKAVLLSSKTVKLRFPNVSDAIVTADLEQLVKEGGPGTTAAVVVSSLQAAQDLGLCRCETAQVIVESYTGLRVPNSAVRTVADEDGTPVVGVYVIIGPKMVFRRISVLTSDGEYSICEETGKSGWLERYDEVIVEGKDLYDNKPI